MVTIIQEAASRLLEAEETKNVIEPLTVSYPGITVDEAYYTQLEIIRRKVENGGNYRWEENWRNKQSDSKYVWRQPA